MRFILLVYYFLKKKILLLDAFKNISVKYNFGNISILLPLNHRLPEFQIMNPKYDKFLPVICQQIQTDEVIIDIGANVGDTLASIVEKNSKPTFLCIEGNDEFFSYLEINIKRIKKKIKDIKIFASKHLVGKNINNVLLKRKEGTARAIIGNGNLKTKTLDEILIDFNDHKNIKLIKIDTDGFDYDVLDSSMETIERYKPILFFECYYEFEFQKEGYKNSIKNLISKGYKEWIIFDNYGEIISKTNSLEKIIDYIEYIWDQKYNLKKNINDYYDLLCYCEKDKDLVYKSLEDFNK
jgi:FkbM family methyltransferase